MRVCWKPRVSITVWADRGGFVYLGEDIVERRVAVDMAHDERRARPDGTVAADGITRHATRSLRVT